LWDFYRNVAVIGKLKGGNFRFAADNLMHFLDNTGVIRKMPNDFITDVLRQDATENIALEHDLRQVLRQIIQPLAINLPPCSTDQVQFSSFRSFPAYPDYGSVLFYTWNAHNVNITYQGKLSRNGSIGYRLMIRRDIHAYDVYDWHGMDDDNLTTLFPTPFGYVEVPDEWAVRVQDAGLAASFDIC
jgi:hypothetical protein